MNNQADWGSVIAAHYGDHLIARVVSREDKFFIQIFNDASWMIVESFPTEGSAVDRLGEYIERAARKQEAKR